MHIGKIERISGLSEHGCVCRKNHNPLSGGTDRGPLPSPRTGAVVGKGGWGTVFGFTFFERKCNETHNSSLQMLLAKGGQCEGVPKIPFGSMGNRKNSLPP